ncbi:hypothetical protein [Leptothoe sp. PORK10 BA2]|uniref:hypothetical protein n=1 Tax=Leptothoe sp. PORK10 BA2 TaxID=3110254 RepID=UPI002B2022EC|nr:hypothetical protein [Leptothoe sp. PORK10 BA2]MEA5465111.1 hypothetical protein [Leptothoe sp. PORK10 BA2]
MHLKILVDTNTVAAQVHLLRELDRWLELGLVSETQVINMGQTLCSRLPIAYKIPEASAAIPLAATSPIPESTAPSLATTAAPAASTVSRASLFSRCKSDLVQSFLAEISVLWLLFLGVFLVVVSSGVLAASQWQSFSTVGQYAILLIYTLAFGAASYWTAAQAKLQTTAQMLKAATLLLIPLNIWMMDALGIIHGSGGGATALAMLATVGLSGLTLVLAPQRRAGLNFLGLSWLHWGWGFALWPILATYVGTVGSAMNLLGTVSRTTPKENAKNLLGPPSGGEATRDEATEIDGASGTKPGGILVVVALIILLVRSLWIAQVPIYQLGLAWGICGWMLCRLHRQYPLWPQLGAGLMLLGWLVSIEQQPLQAMGVSGLAGWLWLERLQRQTQTHEQLRTLSILWLMGLQACGLGWLALPTQLTQTILTGVEKFTLEPVNAFHVAGVWLYGYVGVMVLGSRRFQRQGNHGWALQTEQLALVIGASLVLCALPQVESFLFPLSLAGLTLTFGAFTRLRTSAPSWLIYGTHSAALVTLLSGLYVISARIPDWGNLQWAMVLMGLTGVEWIISVASSHYLEWRRSAWYLGIGSSVMAYSLLLDSWLDNWLGNGGSWIHLIWLVVPGLLTWLVHQQRFATDRPQIATTLTVVALGGQILLLSSWPMATVALAMGAGMLFLHSRRWPSQKYLPALTVGFAVAGGHTAARLWPSPWPHNLAQLFLAMALFAAGLTVLAHSLSRSSSPLGQAYGIASRGWSRGLAVGLSLGLTLTVLLAHGLGTGISDRILTAQPISPDTDILFRYGIAAIALVLARFWGDRRRLTDPDYWELAYGVALGITLAISLGHRETNPQTCGATMAALGLITQLMGTINTQRNQQPYPTSWHFIPLAYGALGLLLGHLHFTGTTGFYSVVLGLVTLAIAQRQTELRPLNYGGLGLLSLGIYELVIHRMLQASGGEPGDGLTILALVGVAIALIYLLCQRWMQRHSQLTETEVQTAALLHWLLAVVLATMAMVVGQSLIGVRLWLGVTSLLSLYGWLKGNYRWFPTHAPKLTTGKMPLAREHPSYSQWTWTGLIIATVAVPYGVQQLLPNLTLLRSWGPLLACGLSLVIQKLPWQRWGWPVRPWQRMALVWPLLATMLGLATVKTQSLLLVGAFYAAMAQQFRAIRLSYISLGLLNWSLVRYLLEHGWLTPLWFSTLVGISALYILEVDPHWQRNTTRHQRHRLRSFATLLVGLTAIFQAETSPQLVMTGLSLLISFGFISLGLGGQVRAYLYTGTLTFALQILRTTMIFISTDGRLLWAVGIVLGITLIWVAATFESRRVQIRGLLNQWSAMLNNWD